MLTIASLHIYPVKSCKGIALQRGLLTDKGFQHDREWLIVREDGRFITQREHPRLALIETAIDAVALTLRAPGMRPLIVPLAERGASVQVTCWKDLCAAHDAGDFAANWLTDFLGVPHRLVRFDPAHRRVSDPHWTGEHEALTKFSDAFPWLIISNASLAELNSRLPNALPMNRFRPNIVIEGAGAYDEDRFDELRLRDVRFKIVKSCTRCIVTTTEQTSGERDGVEPIRTLTSYRMDRQLKGVIFGQNAIALAGVGTEIAVGDSCTASWRS
jgi:uncharacterized protein YcbX